MVYLKEASHTTRLFEIIAVFEQASGQKLNADKTSALLIGTE